MPRSSVLILFKGLLPGLFVCTLAFTAAPAESQGVDVQRLSDRVLVANFPLLGVANVTAVATKRGLVLIDTGATPYVTKLLKQELEKQLGRTDWAYLINTHAHDHPGGNVVFKHLPIIGHDNMLADMQTGWIELMASPEKRAPSLRVIQDKTKEAEQKIAGGAADAEMLRAQLAAWRTLEGEVSQGFEVVIPPMRFSDELTLDMGDVTLRAVYFGKGHSASDVVVIIPEDRVVVSGGVCYAVLPKLADSIGLADLKRSISVLERLLEAGVEHVVPGHAAVLGRVDLERRRDYYRDLLAGAMAAHDQGLTLEQAQAQLALDQRFPCMRDMKPRQGTREEAHASNVAAVWKLITQQ